MNDPTSSNSDEFELLPLDTASGAVEALPSNEVVSTTNDADAEKQVIAGTELPPSSYRPELPDCGVYLQWPMEGHSWIHPSDLSLALKLIPSRRVFHRTRWDNTFYQLHYGTTSIRVRPTMWVRVDGVDLDVGQQVELLSQHGENEAGIYRIADILFSPRTQRIEYFLRRREMTLPKSFLREDLRPLHVQHKLRVGYFQHEPQSSKLPPDLELLDVGDITSEQ